MSGACRRAARYFFLHYDAAMLLTPMPDVMPLLCFAAVSRHFLLPSDARARFSLIYDATISSFIYIAP
jgi:hypothetical protein